MIAVGHCPISDGLQFFKPANGKLVSSIDYTLLSYSTSGALFGYQYQPGLFIYRLDEPTYIFKQNFLLESEVLVHTHSPPHVAKVVGIPSYDRPNIYTVLFPDGLILEYSDEDRIQYGANATLCLSNMTKPRHGKLYLDADSQWFFCQGHSQDLSQGFILHDLSSNFQVLLDTGPLYRGHVKF
jgi:hypothetical protein